MRTAKAICLGFVLVLTALAAPVNLTRGQVGVSLTAVAATGAGQDFRDPNDGPPPSRYTWQVLYTGTPTAITINLEGSLDDTNWDVLDSYAGTTSTGRSVANKPYKFFRCNITSYTVNGSTTTCQVIAAN
jgi:hypothetical protein